MWICLSHIYTHLKCKMRQKFIKILSLLCKYKKRPDKHIRPSVSSYNPIPFCRFIADLTTVTVYGRFVRENGVIEYILSSYIKSPIMCLFNLLNNRAIILIPFNSSFNKAIIVDDITSEKLQQ